MERAATQNNTMEAASEPAENHAQLPLHPAGSKNNSAPANAVQRHP